MNVIHFVLAALAFSGSSDKKKNIEVQPTPEPAKLTAALTAPTLPLTEPAKPPVPSGKLFESEKKRI